MRSYISSLYLVSSYSHFRIYIFIPSILCFWILFFSGNNMNSCSLLMNEYMFYFPLFLLLISSPFLLFTSSFSLFIYCIFFFFSSYVLFFYFFLQLLFFYPIFILFFLIVLTIFFFLISYYIFISSM